MKRKVTRAGKLRLSPNEETMLLKEEYERRRKLRLQQVREQEKYIALQIRQEVKQRKEEQLRQLEKMLRAEWQKAQDQKIKALEKLYLSSLRAVGEGHRQAKENEPDLEALAKQAEERKQVAEKRHRKALKELKYQKENLLREQARRIDARKHALEVERERAARVASLPPPPPHPFENFEVRKIPAVKVYSADNFYVTHYHLSEPYVDREMDREQPDARLVAEEEVKRLEELHREEERDRREQLEKAHLRGNHALKKVRLAQDRERLLRELEQMQTMDRMRRRQVVAQMPPQLFVPAYKRLEIKEDWQKELEFAFEDMYNEDRKMKGDLILQFEPQPLPAPSDRAQDNELDITLEQESACDARQELKEVIEEEVPDESENHGEGRIHQPQSKLALNKLLNKIRSQKEEWTSKSERASQSELETIESGTIASEERRLCDLELNHEQCKNSVSETKDPVEMLEDTVVAEKSVLIHPQEQAAKIRMEEERQKWNEQIEQQKQEQLALLKQIEEKRACLEADFLKIQMQSCLEEVKKKEKEEKAELVQSSISPFTDEQKEGEHETGTTEVPRNGSPREVTHLQVIRSYQQRLLEQNRLHKQTVEEARKCLQEYQNKWKQRYPSIPVTLLSSAETKSVNLKSASEPVLKKQGVHPTQHQLSEQVHAQEYSQSLPMFSGAPHVLEKPSSQKHEEEVHDVCPGRHVQFLETSKLSQAAVHLPCSSPPQEQVGMLETSNTQVRDSSLFEIPSGLVMALQDVPTVTMRPEAHIPQARFILPAKYSAELSQTVGFDKESLSQKVSKHQTETEAIEEPPVTVSLLPTKRSWIAQAASSDSLEYRQGSAENSIQTSFEQPPSLFQPVTLSEEEPKAQGVPEMLISKSGDASLLNYSNILNLRDRVLASSESIQAQQKYLKELQEQLDAQREALLSRQKIQEQLLIRKQDKLKEQMQRQQEALKEILNKQVRHSSTNKEGTQAEKPDCINMTDFLQGSENCHQENCDTSEFHENEMISQCISPTGQTEQPKKFEYKEQKWRSSRPPLTKVRLGLDLEQHELSVIPEIDTPRSCNISFEAWSQDSPVAQDLPVLAPEIGSGVITHSGPSFRLHDMEVLSKVVPINLGSEPFMEGGPCDLSSTISTGSFLASEILDASPADTGLSSGSAEDGIWSHPWNSLLPFNVQQRQENLSGTSGDLNALSEDSTPFQVPAAEFDFPETERHFPNSHHQHFQPLEPSLDLDISSSLSQYRISQDSRELGKTSGFSTKSQDVSVFQEAGDSSLHIQRNSLPSHLETSKSNNATSEQESAKENVTLGSEESFRPLQLESTVSDHCQSADQPVDPNVMLERSSEQNPGIKNWGAENCVSSVREYEELARNIESVNLQCSMEDLRNESRSSLEEQRSFYQLNITPVTVDETLSEHLLKEDARFKKETVCSEKFPVEAFDKEYVKLTEKSVYGNKGNKIMEMGSQWNTDMKKADQGFAEVQKSSRNPTETKLNISDIHLQAVVQQNDSFLERYKKHSNSVLRGSCHIPVWETESGRGIMEEPELTLISSNDVSIAESDVERTSQEKTKEDKINNPACVDHSEFSFFTEERERLPVAPDADDSVFRRPDSPSNAQSPHDSQFPSRQTAVMLLEFVSTPGSLQESFLKRKKNFIEESQKRVEKIKNRERKNEKPEAEQLQRRKTGKLSRRKESSLTSGRFMWGARRSIWDPLFLSKSRFHTVASLLLQIRMFFDWVFQGCGELLFECLEYPLFQCCKGPEASSSHFHNLFTVIRLLANSSCYQRTTILSKLMHL
ncbi:centrosomal protein of 295 kDa isoform X1 [Struthio camelus]